MEKFKKPQVVFHGGCNGCIAQDIFGIDFCVKCQYFRTDWSLPLLRCMEDDKKKVQQILIEKHGLKDFKKAPNGNNRPGEYPIEAAAKSFDNYINTPQSDCGLDEEVGSCDG